MINKEMYFEDNLASQGTSFYLRDESDNASAVMGLIFEKMKERGWFIQTDQRILRDYACLAKDHFEGQKGNLKFKAEKYRMGFKIEFFQEINTVNKSGGYYDFDKLKLMPYLLRLSFLTELKHIKETCKEDGYTDQSKPVTVRAFDKVMDHIKSSCHYKEGKELPEYEVPSYNSKDKDGKRIRNGEVKYFRDRKGCLQRGIVYHNINNMWWVILHEYNYRNIASFEFFDLDSEENRKRKLIKKSGHHKPAARIKFSETVATQISKECKVIGKEGRLVKANEMLSKLYKFDWTSRLFAFELKANGRLSLIETESKAWGNHKVHEIPVKLSLYGRTLPMSSTESYWVKALREYVVYGKRTITEWFCKDSNGQGPDAHYWPEVRKIAWEIGALVS
ncbi:MULTISPECIES: hypothetical protein [Paenibacillus]|uniref:hypothetical protein n=1 Tax=Paenibacillus TaxID=44249 RepID=UPI0009D7708A|nr:hypothetical protein [Paenibacillus odorifer]